MNEQMSLDAAEKLGHALAAGDASCWLIAIESGLDFSDSQIASTVINGMLSENSDIRLISLRRAAKLRAPATSGVLLRLAGESTEQELLPVVWAMGRTPDGARDFEPILLSALADSNKHIRHNAAESLGLLRLNSAVAPLRNSCVDPSLGVRLAAVDALVAIGSEDSLDAVASFVVKSRWNFTSTSAIDTLVKNRTTVCDSALERIARDASSRLLARRARRAISTHSREYEDVDLKNDIDRE